MWRKKSSRKFDVIWTQKAWIGLWRYAVINDRAEGGAYQRTNPLPWITSWHVKRQSMQRSQLIPKAEHDRKPKKNFRLARKKRIRATDY